MRQRGNSGHVITDCSAQVMHAPPSFILQMMRHVIHACHVSPKAPKPGHNQRTSLKLKDLALARGENDKSFMSDMPK